MAQIQLQVPAPFNYANPDDWSRWKKQFQRYRCASGLGKEDPARQISTLLYCLGEEAGAVLDSTNATEDERKVYDTVIWKFDSNFKVRKNVIYERTRFNRRSQLQGESAEQYIMELYRLAETCEYGNCMQEMNRDKLVVGIADNALSGSLQLDPDLTLEKAKKTVRQSEAVRQQQGNLKEGADKAEADEAIFSGWQRGRPGDGKCKGQYDSRGKKYQYEGGHIFTMWE